MIFKAKRSLFLLIMLIVFCSFGQNVLKNGNFLKTIGGNKPADWTIYPNPLPKGSSIVVDTTNSYTGGKSVRIHNNNVVYTRIDQPNVKVKPRTWYLISYYVKGDNINIINGCGPRIFIGPNGGYSCPLATFGPGTDREQKKNWSFPWKKYSRKLYTGNNTKIGVLLYLHKTTGTIWFDNVKIVEITPDMDKREEVDIARKIIGKEICTVKKAAEKQKQKKLIKKLDALNKKLENWSPENKPARMKGLPFYPFQEKVYSLMSKLLEGKYPDTTVFISPANPFERTKYLQSNLGNSAHKIKLAGLCGDIEQFALNLTNCSAKNQKVSFTAPEGLDVKVRQVIEVEIDNAEFIDDALVLMSPGEDGIYSLTIPAGITKQLWFEVKLPESPATINGKLNFKFCDKEKNIDVNLIIHNKKFPVVMPLKLFVWGYPFIRRLTKGRISQCAADYKKHHVNTFYINKFEVPMATFDKSGKILPKRIDWSGFDKYLKNFPSVSTYIISADSFWRPHIFIKGIKLKKMSPQWKACLKAWIKKLVEGLQKRGIGYDRFLLVWFDEPNTMKVNTLAQYAKIVHEADPKIRFYSNFNNALNHDYVKKLAKTVDIIAPEYREISPETIKILKNSGREIWMYRVQSKDTLPQNIRKSFWMLHKNNIKGATFWCYSDNNVEWSPRGTHCYSVIYGGDSRELTPSKRWEAWREGIEDYTLLTMLKARNLHAYQKIINRYNDVKIDSLRKQLLTQLCK